MTGYVRTDTTNNIADGNVISAADLDNEFNGVQAAFNSSTGHTHDGSSAEGAPITKLGPVQDVTVSTTVLGVKTTNTVDLGTSSLKFKDFYLAGAASIGGTLGVTGATTLSAALTYGGVTLSNAVTGTGNMVLSASPTLTGTITAAAANFSGAVALNGNATIGDADTDTITQAASYVTGTQLKSAKAATNTLSLAAYDVDGTAYTNLITLTASNTPTLALTSTGVGTINNMSIGATTASTGAFTTLSATDVIKQTGNPSLAAAGATEAFVAHNTGYGAVLYGQGTTYDVALLDRNTTPRLTVTTTAVAVTGTFSSTLGATIQGLTVGLGGGAVATNTAVGVSALAANTTAVENTAVGYYALKDNTAVTNTAFGAYAAYKNTSGTGVSAFGNGALQANETGVENSGFGKSSLSANISGSYNTAIGRSALQSNTTASNNTAVGYQAGYTNTTNSYNVFLGYQAGYTSNYNGNGFNTCVGVQVGYSLTTGRGNTFIGGASTSSGYYVTSGDNNTILGGYTGLAAPISQTGSNYIVLSDGDGSPRFVHKTAAGATSLPGTSGAYSSSTGTFDSTLQIGSILQLMSYSAGSNTQVQLTSNAYYSSGYKAISGGAGSSKLYIGAAGIFEFAGSAVLTNAGDAITYTKTLDCGGLGYSIALQNATSLAGTGITFPATQFASSNANTLDDYEEGTWTPNLERFSTQPTVSYTSRIGTYVKIGKTVIVHASIYTDTVSANGSGICQVKGLPFAPNSTLNYAYNGIVHYNSIFTTANARSVMAYLNSFVIHDSGINTGEINENYNSNSYLSFTAIYQTDA